MRKQYSAAFKADLVTEVLKEEKTISRLAAEHGGHPVQISQWKAVALKALPSVFEKDGKKAADREVAHEKEKEALYQEIGRLQAQVSWMKKKLALSLRRDERVGLIEREERELPLVIQADLLGVSRASLYYPPVGPGVEEVALKRRIDEIYTACPFYGSRKIAAALAREGPSVNRKAVQRHMREMGIAGITPGPNLSRRNNQQAVSPYLLRNLVVERPDHVWGIDITYIRLVGGWVYLVAALDWYSRTVVSWEIDQTLEMPFVLECVGKALRTATPEILNSDQGSPFTSEQSLEPLRAKGVRISMDGRGRALDNIFTERLWRSVKYEEVYLKSYETPREARRGLNGYLRFYNTERPHQALGYRTPAEVYAEGHHATNPL